MIDAALSTAIVARLRADTTLTALLPSGTSSIGSEQMAPRDQSGYPYISVMIDATPQADGFTLNGLDCQFSVRLSTLTTLGLVAPSAILARIYGDQTSRTPTYGLHRWVPSSSIGGFSNPMICLFSDSVTDHSVDHYGFVSRFRLDITQTAS